MDKNKTERNKNFKINVRINALSTKRNWWIKAYIFIFLPALIILDSTIKIRAHILGLYNFSFYDVFLHFRLIWLIFTFIFMLKASKAGYYLNIVSLAFQSMLIFTLFSYIIPESDTGYYFILLTGTTVALLWFGCNFIYFQKRRFVLFDEYAQDISSQEELKEKYTELINEETARKAANDIFKIRLDAYNKDKKWLKNYFCIFLPVCIAAEATYIYVNLHIYYFVYTRFNVDMLMPIVVLLLSILTFIHARKINLKTAYYFNIILLFADCLFFHRFLFKLIFGFLFLILNLVYFIKRKDFFFEEKSEIDKA
ncbi:MAG: hypothetical protein AAGU14_02675 [Eubacteriaceae bacterium]